MFRRFFPICLTLTCLAMTAATVSPNAAAETLSAYVGTYTDGVSKGIHHFTLDTETGSLSEPRLVAEMKNPSFLAIHPTGQFLYAVGETADQRDGDKDSGSIHAFAIDEATGDLTALNEVVSGGGAPCHINVDAAGNFALVANYSGGNASVFRIDSDGKLGERTALVQHRGASINPRRQKEPHAHSINLDPANRFALVADLGIDKVMVYRFDAAAGTLEERGSADLTPGSGPRHLCFHPNGKFVFVINELKLTISSFQYDANSGTLDPVQTVSTLPESVEDFSGMSTAEVVVHPSGRFLYGSNRGHDSITVCAVDDSTGKLSVQQNLQLDGKTPRNIVIDPSGKFLLVEHQKSNSIVVYKIDAESGKLTKTEHQATVGSPVCIRFMVRQAF
ncbi:lactonase family protein [Stieleria varia]